MLSLQDALLITLVLINMVRAILDYLRLRMEVKNKNAIHKKRR
jgi:hypothetical protein